jgi:hypothetical protein
MVRRLLPAALFVAAVINGLLVLWILVSTVPEGSVIDYALTILNALSAYGCWIAARHLRLPQAVRSKV